MPNALVLKRCPACGASKPMTKEFFHKSEWEPGGFQRYCRPCKLLQGRTSYAKRHPPLGSPEIKRECPRCHVIKPRIGVFWGMNKSSADGMNDVCNGCRRLDLNQRQRTPESSSEKQRNRTAARKWYWGNPERSRERARESCRKARQMPRGMLHNMLRQIRKRCTSLSIPYDLDIEYLLAILEAQRGLCAITGDQMTRTIGQGIVQTNMSIDRINPKGGYVKGNVQIVQYLANTSKNSMTMEQYLDFCEKVLGHAGRLSWANEAVTQ